MSTKRWVTTLLAVAFAMTLSSQGASAQIRGGFNSNTFGANDDGSTTSAIGFGVNFFGNTYNNLWVNNNGNVTFDGSLSTFTPFNLVSTNRVIIAPFFSDVDTRDLNPVTYGNGTVGARQAFGVNWLGVGHYQYSVDNKANWFQLVMIDRYDTGVGNFDFEFNYGSIQWETGGASGDLNGDGICQAGETNCVSARVGWNSGGTQTFELAGSAQAGSFLDGGPMALNGQRYTFQVRNGQVSNPPAVPEPATLILLGSGLLGVGFVARRRRTEMDA